MTEAAVPSLTFVVRLHDNARFAAAAITAALEQRHPGLEVLVLDDASGDGSAEIARRTLAAYRGPHATRLVCLERNLGCGGALQAAVDASRNDIIVLADGDDLSEPGRAAAVAAAFAGRPDVLLVAHGQRTIDAAGQAFGSDGGLPDLPDLAQAIAEARGLAGAVSAYRRALFSGLTPLDGLGHSEDWLLTVRALCLGQIARVEGQLVQRRSHAGNISGPTAALADPAAWRAWVLRHDARAFAAYDRLRRDLEGWARGGRLAPATLASARQALARGLRRLRLRRAAARLPLRRLPALAAAWRRLGGSRRQLLRHLMILRCPGLMLHLVRGTALRQATLDDVRRQQGGSARP